ncbi:MAG: IS110 family transposase [Flavobacterium psychrophilum]|nr:MAG: IS110 family transposase [Flavobacterium psychrophilum]
MTKVKNFAGLDVSKKFFDVCFGVDGLVSVKRFSNDLQGFKEFSGQLAGDTHCVMEATGPYYLRLALYLHDQGIKVSVINPLVIRRFSQMRLIRAKTDKADARLIMAYGIKEDPCCWEPPKQYIIELQQLQSLCDQLQKHYRALSNQLEAFSASGLLEVGLEGLLMKELEHSKEQIAIVEKQMHELVSVHHGELMDNLTSIPGLGKKTALTLIVLSGGFKKFSNYRQLSAYVGLSPRLYESGTSVRGRSRICKMGMSRIRALLYVCSWSAKKYNTCCKSLYDRLVASGKSKRLALIAVANKLVKQAFAIATSNVAYDKNYGKNICL